MSTFPRQFEVEVGPSYAEPSIPAAGGLDTDAVTGLVVMATVWLAGLHLELAGGIPVSLVVLMALAPIWWRSVGQVEFARLIIGLAIAALVAGYYLAESAAVDHTISASGQRQFVVLILGNLGVMVAVLWGRFHFPLHVVAVAYGLGDFTNAMLFTSRSWKYYLALPATVIVVGWFGKYRHRVPAAAALAVLGVITALDRGRSFFAFCALAACVTVWQGLPTGRTKSSRRWSPVLLLVIAGVATYQLAVSFLTRGYLGLAAQERTVDQIETSGSLILGGRPQWAATSALMRERPWGFGLGVVPNANDYALVSTGFRSLNLEEDGYIRNSMLFGQFRLHSLTADLWARCGLLGLALAIVMGFALIRTLSGLIAQRNCPPIVVLMVIISTWYLAFEPSHSYSRDVFFALGITLLSKRRADPDESLARPQLE